MPNANSLDRCELYVGFPCPAADKQRHNREATYSSAVDLALSCILLVFSAMALRRFLSKPGSSLCRWTAHQTFHFSHIVFCVLRIITDAMWIAYISTMSSTYASIAEIFEDCMIVAGTFMWLSLMCFWYQVTMPPNDLLKAFQVLSIAVFVVFTVALVVNSVRSGVAASEGNLGVVSCTQMNGSFILFLNSAAMYLFTSFVAERVSSRLKRMEDEGQVSVTSIRITEYIFLYCCAAFAVRGAGFYVQAFQPLPAFCSVGGFWQVAMFTWIPLTTSFLFLAVMWRSGVAEMRSEDPVLEDTDEESDMAVGMEDVPDASRCGNNPVSEQSGNDGPLVELTLRP